MDLSTIKDLYVGSTPVQSAWLGGTKVWERRPAVDIQSIFDAMVLWYDPKRQGATNENMAENPVLTDLSGNGHDATCYNFAWSGMSGVGSYTTNFFRDVTRGEIEILGAQKWIVKNVTQDTSIANELILQNENDFIGFEKTVTVRVSGINENNTVHIRYSSLNQLLHNGDNTVTFPPKRTIEEGDSSVRYVRFAFSRDCTNITIEILPEYPNALVADGVDDYIRIDGTPILTDYTVIAKRKLLSESDGTYRAFAAKGTTAYQGAFILERYQVDKDKYEIYNFGELNAIAEIPTDITYMTSNSYNGNTIAKGNAIDEDIVHIFARHDDGQYISAVLYSFILFNRTLTEEEINWVKTNLIEGDTEL